MIGFRKAAVSLAATLACAMAGPAMAKTPRPLPPLSAYVGKDGIDTVDGVAFLDHPLVRAAIEQATTSPEIRAALQRRDAVPTPIRATQGRLLMHAFAPESGGDVNWALLIVADGSRAAVCYSTGVETDVRGADRYYQGALAFTLFTRCPDDPKEVEASMSNWPIGAIPS